MSRAATLLRAPAPGTAPQGGSLLATRAPLVQRSCAACGAGKSEGGTCPACAGPKALDPVQAKLTIGAPGDRLEMEADAIAGEVMRTTPRASAPAVKGMNEDGPQLQRRAAAASEPTTLGFEQGMALQGAGAPLPATARSFFEPRFARDLGHVRIHADSSAGRLAANIHARAFTHGADIYFATGQYQPASDGGRRLLAHELAHVVHNASATQRRPGVAPESAGAERHADRAAVKALKGNPVESAVQDVAQWGPGWAIHRQVKKKDDPITITKAGTRQHTGTISQGGVPVGGVEVRTGEDIESKGGAKMPNMIAIAYSGALTYDSHWLQFVWFELLIKTSEAVIRGKGSVMAPGGISKKTTTDPKSPIWTVDTASTTNPYYESTGVNLRKESSTTIFDHPATDPNLIADAFKFAKSQGGAKSVTFAAHFETYLIQSDVAIYYVSYQASSTFTQNKKGKIIEAAIAYSLGPGGPVASLPAARKKILVAAFPAYKGIK